MRTPSLRIVVSLLAAMMIPSAAPALAEDPPPPPVDEARQSERHAIAPGTESLFGEMLGKGESFPGGCKLTDGQIQRTSVLATYTCGDAPIVLELLHPEGAPSGGARTERFAISTKSGTPPAGLVEAVADRVRAREAAFQWTDVGNDGAPSATGRPRRRLAIAGAAVVALLALWVFRRRARGDTPAA